MGDDRVVFLIELTANDVWDCVGSEIEFAIGDVTDEQYQEIVGRVCDDMAAPDEVLTKFKTWFYNHNAKTYDLMASCIWDSIREYAATAIRDEWARINQAEEG